MKSDELGAQSYEFMALSASLFAHRSLYSAAMPKKQSAVDETNAAADATAMIEEALTFEQAYDELQTIVIQLERGDLPLEQSMTLHARGQTLVAFCSTLLDAADLRVRQIDPVG